MRSRSSATTSPRSAARTRARSRTSPRSPAARSVVVVRLLGGRRAWPEGVSELRSRCEQQGTALILLGGEAEPDAELAELSLAPAGAVAQAFEYLRHGGVDNTRELLRFLADTFALTGYGFEDPQPLEDVGFYPANPERDGRPRVGVVFYRSHFATGNTAFIDALATAIEDAGGQAVARLGLLASAATRPR